MTGDPVPVEPLAPEVLRWEELLHDWTVRSEHDGGYVLLRCRVCGTEGLR